MITRRTLLQTTAGSIGLAAMTTGETAVQEKQGRNAAAAGPVLVDRAFVRIKEGLVHYRHSGTPTADRPLPLYLMHAGPGSSKSLAGLIELLGSSRHCIAADTLGFGKPDPRVYLEACRRVDTPAQACVCVGDSIAWDVLGARDAGLRAVWLDRGVVGTDEDVTRVTSLDELTSALHAGRTRSVVDRFGATGDDR